MTPFGLEPDVQKFQKDQHSTFISPKSKKEQLEALYKRLLPRFTATQAKFKSIITKELDKQQRGKVRILSAVKPFESLYNKVIERGKKLGNIGDIVRGAMLFDTDADVSDFMKRFTRKNAHLIVKHEKKEKGTDHVFGYFGAHHLDLVIDGLITELQVTTKKLWNYKAAAHVFYHEFRTQIASGGSIPHSVSHASKKIFSLGNKQRIRESVEIQIPTQDEIVKRYNTFKNRGIPRSQMPQVTSKDLPEFIEYLKKKGITIERVSISPSNIKVVQKHINPSGIQDLIGVDLKILSKPFLISGDNYLLDGHHRHMAHIFRGTKRIEAWKIGQNVDAAIDTIKKFPKVEFRSLAHAKKPIKESFSSFFF